MWAALDQSWAALPPEQQTAEYRERIAEAIMGMAKRWGRDPAQVGAVSPAERAQISRGVY